MTKNRMAGTNTRGLRLERVDCITNNRFMINVLDFPQFVLFESS